MHAQATQLGGKKHTHLGVQLTDLAHGWSDLGMQGKGAVEADARGFRFTAEKKEELLDSFPKPSPSNELLWTVSNEALFK